MRADGGTGAGARDGVCEKELSGASGSGVYAFGWAQSFGKCPCAYRVQQSAETGCGWAGFYGTGLRQPCWVQASCDAEIAGVFEN